jgi:hypothetical protein
MTPAPSGPGLLVSTDTGETLMDGMVARHVFVSVA